MIATASMNNQENLALRACSLRAIPPPPPEGVPLEELAGVNLHEANLTQWASYVQDVASGMRKPPQAALDCPVEDMVGILHRLEGMMGVTFCQCCFMVGTCCDCYPKVSSTPTPSWNPPRYNYAAKTTVTSTSASTSTVGVPPAAETPPGYAMLPPSMDASLLSKIASLLVKAGVGRGATIERMLARPTGLCQVWPQLNPQRQVIPDIRGATQATPYRQQVPVPQVPRSNTGTRLCTAVETTRPSTTTSTASDMEAGTRGRSRERFSIRGSRDQSPLERRPRSSTRGSRKRRRGVYSQNPMDDLNRYVPSGWRMDLMHIVSCHYATQIGPLKDGRWDVDSQAFLQAMRDNKKEWLEIKELDPLNYMRYMANLFKWTTSHHLHGLSRYTGWIRAGGYYHWKAAELNQFYRCSHLRGIPVPLGPLPRPSTEQTPPKNLAGQTNMPV